MPDGPEFTEVEQPFLDQLVRMDWEHTTGDLDDPRITGRESFREVLHLTDLKVALRRINLDPDGNPWLDDGRITQAINALQRPGPAKLTEANQKATELLLKGTVVDGVEGWEQGRGRTVHFIDWDHPKNDTFRVINQFQVACPAGQPHDHMRPDIVLFVNGIPLVVVEAKSPYLATPMEDAINQLQRYANRRRGLGIVDVPGHERFVRTMVAGATGVDLGLLVVAADDGVMPQTREHVEILDLLGVATGAITITKADMVPDERIEEVRVQIASLVASTTLHDWPVVVTSAKTGQGLDGLTELLGTLDRKSVV